MFRKDKIGRRGGVLLYINEIIPAYEVGAYSYLRKQIVMRPYGAN